MNFDRIERTLVQRIIISKLTRDSSRQWYWCLAVVGLELVDCLARLVQRHCHHPFTFFLPIYDLSFIPFLKCSITTISNCDEKKYVFDDDKRLMLPGPASMLNDTSRLYPLTAAHLTRIPRHPASATLCSRSKSCAQMRFQNQEKT